MTISSLKKNEIFIRVLLESDFAHLRSRVPLREFSDDILQKSLFLRDSWVVGIFGEIQIIIERFIILNNI